MDKEYIKLEPGNRISMPMELYERIKAFDFCKDCGCVIDACDCAELTEFAQQLSKRINKKAITPDSGLMNNIMAYRLGLVGLKLIRYPEQEIGDEIDRGLVLCRLLNESGFKIVYEKTT